MSTNTHAASPTIDTVASLRPSWGKRAVSGLFVALPLLMVLAMGHVLLDLHRELFQEEQRRELTGRMSRLADEANPFHFMPKMARELHSRLRAEGMTPEAIDRVCREASALATVSFDLYVFDAAGTLIESRTHPEETRTFMQTVWLYHCTQDNQYYDPNFSRIKQYFGQYFNFQYFQRRQGQALPMNGRNGNGLILWLEGPQRKRDGLLLAVSEVPPLAHFLTRAVKAIEQSGISLWITGADGVERQVLGQEDVRADLAGQVGMRLQLEESLQFQNVRVRAVANPVWKLAPMKSALNVFFLLLVVVLVVGSLYYGEYVDQIYISIKTKLYFLFLYLTLLATLGLATLGLRQSSDREAVAFADAGKAAQEVLAHLDSDFSLARLDCLRFFRSLRDDPHLRAGDLKTFERRLRGQVLNWLEVRHLSGEPFFTTQKRDRDIEFVNRANAKRNIERFIPERLPAGTTMTYTPPEIMVQSVVETPVSGWLRIFEAPDDIHIMQFGQFALWFYWDAYRQPDSPYATITMNKNQHVAAWEYLTKRMLERFSHGQTALRIVAWRS
ncbi:MAG TPA: hypothetical protein PKO06_04140, partial [Candidatus Ozemobacteraceae bacterium]|nr:hypothetical protein [Candidatus Ozemobacteraceae bacterium]